MGITPLRSLFGSKGLMLNMYPHPNSIALSMISEDADYMYPCFKMEEVEKALVRMTSKLGFQRVHEFDSPAVFTFEYDDLKLMVMTTPKVFHNDRLCYALSGMLIASDEWSTEIAPLGYNENEDLSTWRNHPKDFYLDLLDAVASLRPDMWLPERRPRLLGPATDEKKSLLRQLTSGNR